MFLCSALSYFEEVEELDLSLSPLKSRSRYVVLLPPLFSNLLMTGLGRYGGRGANGSRFSRQGFADEGVYRYEGGKVEPYGARGTVGSKSSSETLFDDYGRPINLSKGGDSGGSRMPTKVVKVIPKADTDEDAKNGVQKYFLSSYPKDLGRMRWMCFARLGWMEFVCLILLQVGH